MGRTYRSTGRLYTLKVQNRWNAKDVLTLQFDDWGNRSATADALRKNPDVEILDQDSPGTAIYRNADAAIETVQAYFGATAKTPFTGRLK